MHEMEKMNGIDCDSNHIAALSKNEAVGKAHIYTTISANKSMVNELIYDSIRDDHGQRFQSERVMS